MSVGYYERLRLNRESHGITVCPCREAWKAKVLTTPSLQYDPCYDYAIEVESKIIYDNKYKYNLPDADAVAKQILYVPNGTVDKHRLAYNYWIDYKYYDFKKEYIKQDHEGLNYIHLTINFRPDIPIDRVVEETTRILSLAVFSQTQITYCYEFHTNSGSHPHVHALIELTRTGTIKKGAVEQAVFKKKGVKDILNLRFGYSNGKGSFKAGNRATCLAYIQGHKIDEKADAVNNDKEWRRLNNLENVYIKNNL